MANCLKGETSINQMQYSTKAVTRNMKALLVVGRSTVPFALWFRTWLSSGVTDAKKWREYGLLGRHIIINDCRLGVINDYYRRSYRPSRNNFVIQSPRPEGIQMTVTASAVTKTLRC